MKALLSYLAPALTLFLLGSNSVYAVNCQTLISKTPQNVEIKTTMMGRDNEVRSPYCLVSGVMSQRMGVDSQFYSIKFELRLPNFWQGRFAYQFNGGNDGQVKPALGAMTGLIGYQYAINQGFAVVSSNGGHDAQANPEDGLAGPAVFGHDPEARRDYGYSAVQKLNPVVRSLIESYYESPIKYSYGLGQSNGGRMAMVAATRFPNMFDGLLVGYPGFNLPRAALQHAWDIQALHRVSDDISQSLTKRDLDVFAKRIIDQCDTLDGISDDMVFAADACQKVFEPKALVCKSNFDRDCLSLNKIGALMRMHMGPHNSKNQALYTDWVYDTGIRSDNWRMWKVESTMSGWSNKPINIVMGAASLAHIFTTPYTNVAGDIYSLENYLLQFDFDKDAPKIYATNNQFKESAMAIMTPPDAAKPKLTEFKQHGGKMVIFHGNSDPVFSVKDTMRWYDFLNFTLEGRASEFVRLYRVPGMPHGQGGPSADQFDMLQPLVSWVEKKQPPQHIVAATRAENPEITARMTGIKRPLCPYPSYARYNKGDFLQATSFQCVVAK
ncbi:tannase/feruloyl esterase family alpha/beta hydrolase [Marinomonas rhizomae]|uniref:Feruloyl esterase n=1 Tax=Marinomonas rhizomae TaxID=491948 RepID=A0A366JDI5_9GAMM|nr:tannase/feruloyl esterase family alpha/beta hydrolase [Marinomonas rhizomae]RBP85051.1 feruloyl esterase [Marinomonas rhizomae]RNF76165.1 tannase/feruloyl esterase family alpha/beta hydrolase [Marinomonas rhizomae]